MESLHKTWKPDAVCVCVLGTHTKMAIPVIFYLVGTFFGPHQEESL